MSGGQSKDEKVPTRRHVFNYFPIAVFCFLLIVVLVSCDDGAQDEDIEGPSIPKILTETAVATMATDTPTATPTPSATPGIAETPTLTHTPSVTSPPGTPSEPEIQEELDRLGINYGPGNLGFIHPPISLEVTDYEDYASQNFNALTVARDFVMAADITWESRFAESGCGFVVRSDGNENAFNQYIIGITRGAMGHVLFAEQIDGDVDLDRVSDIYARDNDPSFDWQSGGTNRIVVVGRDQQFEIYSNDAYLGTITGTASFEEGFVAFVALNRSGGIKCDFNDAYLWRFD